MERPSGDRGKHVFILKITHLNAVLKELQFHDSNTNYIECLRDARTLINVEGQGSLWLTFNKEGKREAKFDEWKLQKM